MVIPGHNVVGDGRGGYTGGRIGLHALFEQRMLAFEPSLCWCLPLSILRREILMYRSAEREASVVCFSDRTLKSRIRRRRAEVDMVDERSSCCCRIRY